MKAATLACWLLPLWAASPVCAQASAPAAQTPAAQTPAPASQASTPASQASAPASQASTPAFPAMGSVSARDADVVSGPNGQLRVAGDRVQLVGSSTVTARDHTAAIALSRGGSIAVCRSSALHLTEAAAGGRTPPLLLALDRGALEVRMPTVPGDAILTPDLRLAPVGGGSLDLSLYVTASGDTCLDNAGDHPPVISITDAFGETSYLVKPGQHVTFEHADLHAVVDRETTPCGCPPASKPGVSVAEALLSTHGTVTPAQAAAAHPFPAAVSGGLAEPAPLPPEGEGTHVQVATTLAYDPSAPPPAQPSSVQPSPEAAPAPAPRKTPSRPVQQASSDPALSAGVPTPASPSAASAPVLQPQPDPPAGAPLPAPVPARPIPDQPKPGPFHALGRFFKHLFVR